MATFGYEELSRAPLLVDRTRSVCSETRSVFQLQLLIGANGPLLTRWRPNPNRERTSIDRNP
jgi:hypothetical protein